MKKKLEPLIASVLGAFFLLYGITQYLEAMRNIAFKSLFLTNGHYAFITGIFAIVGATVMTRYGKIGGLMLFVSSYFSYLVGYWLIYFIPISSLFQEFLLRLLMMLFFVIVGISAIIRKPWDRERTKLAYYKLLNGYRTNTNIFRSLASVTAGATISATISLYFHDKSLCCALFCIFSILLLLYGFGVCSQIYHCYNIRNRRKKLKIGILNDIPYDEEDCWVHTKISSENWEDELKKCGAKNTGLITVLDNFDKYTAILNPYGGAYPESDLSNRETLNKILNYVREGGLFINVADIPGYFACPLVKPVKKIEIALRNAPYAYGFRPDCLLVPVEKVPFLGDTPFMEELGLRIINTKHDPSIFEWSSSGFEDEFKEYSEFEIKNIKVYRAVIVEKNIDPVIKPKPTTLLSSENVEVTPLFFVKYGNGGKFLFSLIWINEQEDDVKEKLVTALAKLIVHATQSK